jgi:putative spermidine/putrescine transport system permease protein
MSASGAQAAQRSASLLLAPCVILLATCFVLPLLILLLYSFYTADPGGSMRPVLTVANYTRFLFDGLYYRVIWRSLELGFIVTLASLLLGFPLAYSLARTRSGARRGLVVMLLLFPLMTSVVVRSYGWLILLGDTGLLNVILLKAGLITTPVRLLYTEAGTIIALVEVLLPFMVLSLMAVMRNVTLTLEEAAASLGASGWRVLIDVVLPLSMPGIAAGSMLVFILSIGAFVTPTLIGGAKTLVVPMLVFQQAMAALNWPFAAAISFIFLVFVLALVWLQLRLLERQRHGVAT